MSLLSLLAPTGTSRATGNSFAGVSGLSSRFQAQNFDSSSGIWVDSINSNTSVTSASGSLSNGLNSLYSSNLGGVDGSVGNFQAVSGRTNDFIRFPFLFQSDDYNSRGYSVFYVARYSNAIDESKRKRILTAYWHSGDTHTNVAAGFHDGNVGKMFYVGHWFTDTLHDPICFSGPMYMCQASISMSSTPQSVVSSTDWVIIGFSLPKNVNSGRLRTNGLVTAYEDPDHLDSDPHYLGINVWKEGGVVKETSDFELADFMVFDGALSDADMKKVEVQLAKTYGIALYGTAPSAPVSTLSAPSESSLEISWTPGTNDGSGEIYSYQTRVQDMANPHNWTYHSTADAAVRSYDFVAAGDITPAAGHSYRGQVRALSTEGWSEWSELSVATYDTGTTNNQDPQQNQNQQSSQQIAPSLSSQSFPALPSVVKKGKSIALPLKSNQGSTVAVSSSKGCKISSKVKTVKSKVNGKMRKVKINTAWLVTGKTKKKVCDITITAPAISGYEALSVTKQVTVK